MLKINKWILQLFHTSILKKTKLQQNFTTEYSIIKLYQYIRFAIFSYWKYLGHTASFQLRETNFTAGEERLHAEPSSSVHRCNPCRHVLLRLFVAIQSTLWFVRPPYTAVYVARFLEFRRLWKTQTLTLGIYRCGNLQIDKRCSRLSNSIVHCWMLNASRVDSFCVSSQRITFFFPGDWRSLSNGESQEICSVNLLFYYFFCRVLISFSLLILHDAVCGTHYHFK